MKIYLWYDEIRKRYVTEKCSEFTHSLDEVLYAFETHQLALSQKVAGNLNKIK
ncbi:MAG: hypothetical protein RLN88_14500 [Ekhidna sp.]|uniref:hypothetical protein n=1 Tax=Ekhidna sp. TaxID=2608089 RepID=UPI0032EF876B